MNHQESTELSLRIAKYLKWPEGDCLEGFIDGEPYLDYDRFCVSIFDDAMHVLSQLPEVVTLINYKDGHYACQIGAFTSFGPSYSDAICEALKDYLDGR